MGVFVPVTRFSNRTNDVMVLVMLNDRGYVKYMKVIPARCHVDLGYRKRVGQEVTFWVLPESRSGVPGKGIIPIGVFQFANIDIWYKLIDGSAFVDFYFMKDTMLRRIRLAIVYVLLLLQLKVLVMCKFLLQL